MNRLAKLKEWLTPADAARQLTVTFKAPCSKADVLRLGLDHRLVLSVRFMSPVRLLRSGSAPIPGQPDEGKQVSQKGDRRTTPAEIWDLPLTGSERASVEERCQLLAGGRQHGTLPSLPAYVKSPDGELWQLPSRGLPPGYEIVIRSDALAELEAGVGAPQNNSERPIGTREKRILHTFIDALCHIGKIDLAEHGIQKKILGAAQLLGLSISAATISQIVDEVRQSLEDRRK